MRPNRYRVNRDGIAVAILEFMDRGQTPTLREVSDVTGVATSTLHSYVGRMTDEGLVVPSSRSHRSLRLTEFGQRLARAAQQRP